MNSRCFFATVAHTRRSPVAHSLRYRLPYFAFDLDELETLDASVRGFGHNRPNLFALRDADYLGDVNGSIRDKLNARLAKRDLPVPDRAVLLTMARTLGHAFNPVSFYFCYRRDQLTCVVVEVNNTFGEGHLYFLEAGSDGGVAQRQRKRFHVSPFNDMRGDYQFRIAPVGESLSIGIRLERDGEAVLDTSLTGDGEPITSAAIRRIALRFPLSTFATLPRILWHAARLHYQRGLGVHGKPEPSSPDTFTATYPAYVSEFRAPRSHPFARRPARSSEEPR